MNAWEVASWKALNWADALDYGASLLDPFIEAGDAKWAFSELSPKRHDASAPPTC
jgi:hypothetical protein